MGDAYVGTIQQQADTRGLKRPRTEPIRLCQNIFDVQRRDLLGVLTTLRSVFFADDLELDDEIDVEEEIGGTKKRGKIVGGDGMVMGNVVKIDPPAQPLPVSRAQTPPPTLFSPAPRTPPNTNTSSAFTASPRKTAAPTIKPSPVPKITAAGRESRVSAAKIVSAKASGGTSTTARMDTMITGQKKPVPAVKLVMAGPSSQPVTGSLTQPAVKAKFTTAKPVRLPSVPAPALRPPIIQQSPSTPFESLFSLKTALTIEAKKLPPHYNKPALFARLDAFERDPRYTNEDRLELAVWLLHTANSMRRKDQIERFTEMKSRYE